MPSSIARPRPTRPALATWLFLSALAATVAAIATCTLLIDAFVERQARGDAIAYLQAHADSFRFALDRGMARNYDEVRVIAQLDEVALAGDPARTRGALDRLHARFPQFAWLGLAAPDGVVLASTDGLLTGRDVSARPWFAGARDRPYVGDVHRAVLLEKLLPAAPEPWRFVDIATPVRNADGSLRGILGAHLSWSWAGRIERELVDPALRGHAAQALVLAADGTVLLGPEALEGRRLDPSALTGDLVAESGTAGAGDYPGLGWRVVLTQPESVAMQGYRELQRRTVACALLLCALLVPILWVVARRLSSPLHQLARRLDGSPCASAGAPLYREAEQLREALDRHEARQREDAERLRELNAELEARVALRTAELARSNEELRAAERQMAQLARTDALTGLPNRYSFDERLEQSLARSRRSGQPIALCFLDIDRFKAINDTWGHGAGDEVLRQFARRLTKCVRETDTVARLAGDEFVVILEGLHTSAEPQLVARKIVSMMRRPLQVEGRPLEVTTSVGVAFEADATVAAAALLERADAALYEAKAKGRDAYCVDVGSAQDPAGAAACSDACPL